MKKFKKPKVQHDTWGHHETMLINLRDWVRRELDYLRNDLASELPTVAKSPNMVKILKSADDASVQLFDLIRSAVDIAELEAAKAKKKSTAVQEQESDEFSSIDA